MSDTVKIPSDKFLETARFMSMFQVLHNALRIDFQSVYDYTKNNLDNNKIGEPLIRVCYKELFSFIEADIYTYNQFLPYPKYSDRDSFITKFKKTYKYHAKMFNKLDISNQFNSSNIELLVRLKEKRDKLTHPKGFDSIEVRSDNLKEVYSMYEKYTKYIRELMTGVYIQPDDTNAFLKSLLSMKDEL